MPNKKNHKTAKSKDMDKVKIKRVKRVKKHPSTKEKIVAGLGLGSTLLGGASALGGKPQTPQTQFVRTAENEKSSSSTSRIKQALSRVFGVKTAKADFTPNANAFLPNNPVGQQNLPYNVSTDGQSTTITLQNGQTASYSNQQELLGILSQANANPGSVDPNLVAALTNNYYGQYYNNSASVTAAYAPESPGNISWNNFNLGQANPNNMPNPWQIAGAQAITNAQGQVAGSIVHVGGNAATDQVGVWIADPTGNSSGTTRTFASEAEANSFLRQQGLVSNYSGQTNTLSPVTQTLPTQTPITVTVSNVVSIYNENHEITATQGDYNGHRYALAWGILYDGNGNPLNDSEGNLLNDSEGNPLGNLSREQVNAIIANLSSANPLYSIITDSSGNPISVWNQTGNEETDNNIKNQILASYNGGTPLVITPSGGGGGGAGGGGGGGGSGTEITAQRVLSELASRNTSYIQGLLNGTGMDINANLASNPEVASALYNYMVANNLTQGYSAGSLGSMILGMLQTTTGNQVTPGKGVQQFWSTEGLTEAYNSSIHPYTLNTTRTPGGQTLYSVTVNTGSGNVTSAQMTSEQVNQWLTQRWQTSDAFLALSKNDQAIFAAFIQAGLANPEFLGRSNLPQPNTPVTETVTFVDANGQLQTITQPWGTGMLISEANARLLAQMFPGYSLTVMSIPNSSDYQLNVNGETRRRYQLTNPATGEGMSAGLLWQQFTKYGASGIFGINNIPGFNQEAAQAAGVVATAPITYVSGNLGGISGKTSEAPTINGTNIRTSTITAPSTVPSGSIATLDPNIWILPTGNTFNINPVTNNSDAEYQAWRTRAYGADFSATNVIFSEISRQLARSPGSITPAQAASLLANADAVLASINAQKAAGVGINEVRLPGFGAPALGTNTGAAVISTSQVLREAQVGQNYSQRISGSNIAAWENASLPSWLTFNSSTGTLSGTPTAVSNTPLTFTLTAKNSAGQATSKQFTIPKINASSATTASIVTASLPAATVGSAYPSTSLSAIGLGSSVSWSATGLPTGMVLSSAGALSGTPSQSGTFAVVVTARGTSSVTKSFVLTINPASNTLAITSVLLTKYNAASQQNSPIVSAGISDINAGSIKVGVAGQNFTGATVSASFTKGSQTINVSPAAISRTASSLNFTVPAGTTQNPWSAGTYTLTVRITSSSGVAVTRTASLTVGSSSVLRSASIAVSDLDTLRLMNSAANQDLTADFISADVRTSGDTSTYNAFDPLPPTYSLSNASTINTQTNLAGQADALASTLITTQNVPQASVNLPYNFKLIALCPSGNIAQWVIVSGQLPQGLILGYDGTISGVPAASGSFTFTAKAVDQTNGNYDTKQFTLTVNGAGASGTNFVASVTNVSDDDEPAEASEISSIATSVSQPSVTQVADDSEVEIDETQNTNNTQPGSANTDDEVEVEEVGAGNFSSNSLGYRQPVSLGNGVVASVSNLGNDSEVENEETEAQGTTVTTLSSSSQVASLQAQIQELQSRIAALNQKIAGQSSGGSTVIVQADRQQLLNLQNQVESLTAALNAARQNQATTFDRTADLLKKPLAQGDSYTVKKGDTLWGISKKYYGNGIYWRKILEANTDKVKNPRTMRIGITLKIPELTAEEKAKFSAPAAKKVVAQTQSRTIQNTAQTTQLQTKTQNFRVGDTSAPASGQNQLVSPRGAGQNTQAASYMNQNLTNATGTVVRPSVTDVASDDEVEVLNE